MNCPYCSDEMQKGKSTFMQMQITGTGDIFSFTSDEEAEKSMFKRKSYEKMIMSGTKADSYYCESCKVIMPVIK